MVRWLLLALLSLFFTACSDVAEQQGAATQQGLTNVTIQFGNSNQSRDLQGAGIIPNNVSSISVQAFDKSGAKTFGPFVANKPNFDITIQVTNGDSVRFEVVAFAENNAAGTRLYQGSKTINLTGKSVVVPVVMSLVIDVSSNTAQVAAGASVVLSSTVGGVSSTAASPIIWSASAGSISGNTWIAPNQIGIQTLTARIDPIVNPDQDATIIASIDINVVDQTLPVIVLNGAATVTLEAGAVYTDANATVTDNIDATNGSLVGISTVNTSQPGGYSVTYNYTDTSGNVAATVVRTVNVQDTTAPVFSLTNLTDIYVEAVGVTTPYAFITPAVTDTYGVASVVVSNTGPFSIGTTAVTWTATDFTGLTSTKAQNVIVRDTTLPVITLTGSADVYVEIGGTYTELGATFADAVDGSGSAVVAGSFVNTTIPSTYVVTYDYTDAAGNAAIQASRNVIVQDTIAPAFTLANLADIYVEASGVTTAHLFVTPAVTDTYGVASVLVSNTGPFAIGTTTVTWIATDFAGLTTTKNQNVIVQDTVSPLLVVSPNITLTATQNGGVPTSNSAIQAFLNIDTYATDLVSGSLTVSNDAPSILFPFGVTTVNFSAVDDYANSTVNAATVTVNHAQPSISFPTTNPYTIVVTEDVSSTFTMSVSDVDGDTYSFSLSSSATSGSASVDAYGLVTYQGFLNYAGADSFSVQVSDGYSAPVTQIVNLTVSPVNDAPSVQVNLPIDAYENAAAITIASADLYAADVDNTAAELIFTVTSIPTGGQLRLSSVPLVLSSTFTQADINAGLLTYLPPVTGTFGAGGGSFGFSVTDGASLAISGTFVINVIHVNTSPLFTAPIDHTATPGAGASITASQQIPFDVYVQAYDPDVSDTLTFSVYSYAGLNGVLTGPVSVNTYSAVFSYTANAGTTTDNFQLLVGDGVANDLLDVSVSAIAVNSPPIINSPTNPYSFATLVDTYANFTATASDPNGDTLSWDIYTAATNGLATVDAYGNVSYIENTHYVGNDSFDVRVVDPYGAASILNVNVSILGNANIVSSGVLDNYASTLGSLWQYGVPMSGPNATSGITADPYVWATNLAGNYNQNAAEYLYLPVLDLTAATNPTLSMRLWSTTSYANYHGTNVEVLVGSVWTVIDPYITPYDGRQLNDVNLPAWEELGWTTTEQVYQLAAFDLTPYTGQQIQARLAFRSEGSINQDVGTYVDDIRIDEEASDLDNDGINGVLGEWNSAGTDPFVADSDGDGTSDGTDTQPLNPAAGFAGSVAVPSTAGPLDVYAATDGSLWQYGVPASGPIATSGITADPYVWATNIAGNYPKNSREYLYLPMLDLTAATNPTLSMRLWSTTSYANYHGTNVEVLVGSVWTVIDPYITPYDGRQLNDLNLPAWEELLSYKLAAFDLTPYIGQQIQARLAFRSEGSTTLASGMYVDDIRIDEEASDLDNDGINGVLGEWNSAGTDPFIADSDGDGVLDGADTLPLNPAAGFSGSFAVTSTEGALDVYAATPGTLWQYGIPTSGPNATSAITSDPYVWATNLAGNYPTNARDEALYLPVIDLYGAVHPTLSMRVWSQVEPNWDGANVQALIGGVWTVIDPNITAYNGRQLNVASDKAWANVGYPSVGSSSYVHSSFDLTAYVGQQLQLRFTFVSDGANQYAGVYLDEIRIDEGPTMIAGVDAAISTVNGNCNTTWDIYGSPYWVQSSVSIANGCRLQIDAGVVVKFDPATSVTVNNAASFDVYGAVGSPVYLTSINDDSIAGDSNHDGASVGVAGDWNQIKFAGGSSGSLLNTEVRYAGRSLIRAVLVTTLGTSGSSPTLTNLTIRDSLMGSLEYDAATDGATVGGIVTGLQIINPGGHGIIVSASNARTGNFAIPNIDGTQISGVTGSYSGVSLSGVGAQPIISNMTISGGQHSLFASNGASGTFSGNTFDGATTSAINLSGSTFGPANPSLAGSTITNAPVAVSVSNQTIPVGFAAPNMGANVDPYSVAISITSLYEPYTTLIANPLGVGSQWVQTNNISIPSGVQMDIYAGAVIKRQAGGVLSVNSGATLNILGSAGSPVVFTSINDDAYGSAASGSTGSPIRGEGMWPTYAVGSGGQIQGLLDRFSSSWTIRESIPMSDVTIYDSNQGWSFISGASSPLTQTINNLQIDHWGVGGVKGLIIDGAAGTNAMVFTGSNRITKYTATAEAIEVKGAGANPTFQNFVVDMKGFQQPALRVWAGGGGTYNNNIFRNASSGITLGGIQLADAAGAATISDNKIVNNTVGIHVINAPNGTTIENNLIRGSLSHGVLVDMIPGLSPSHVLMRNNLIVENISGNTLATAGSVHVRGDGISTGPTVDLYSNTIADNTSSLDTIPAGLVVDAYATVHAIDNFIVFNKDSLSTHIDTSIDIYAVVNESYNATSDNSLAGLGDQFSSPAAPPFEANWYQLNSSIAVNNGSMLASVATFINTNPYAEIATVDGAGADMLDLGYHHPQIAPTVSDLYSSPTQLTLNAGANGSTEISVVPHDINNVLIGAGLNVVASFQVTSSGTLDVVKDHGDGSYSVILNHSAATGASDTVAISVNGVQLTPSLTIGW